MQRNHIRPAFEPCAESASIRPENAGRMRLVHRQHALMPAHRFRQLLKGRAVAVHAVKAFHRDPGPPPAARRPPGADLLLERPRIVMSSGHAVRPARPHAVMRACVDQFVVHHEVAALGQGREQRVIRRKAAAEVERGLSPEEPRGLVLQRLVLGVIAAQEPRAARTRRHATVQRVLDRRLQLRRVRKAQIVVRGEIVAGSRCQLPEPPARFKPRQHLRIWLNARYRRRMSHRKSVMLPALARL